MYIKIPFESEIPFKSNISEITKMSLEHEFNVNDGVVLGNFYISGEYRVHEVSINREPFNYTLPFTVELRDDIKKDTLEFNIEDFSYDVSGKLLKVNIEYSLKAEVEEDNDTLFERVDEEELESELAYIDSFLETSVEEDKEDVCEEVELEERKDAPVTLIDEIKIEEKKETVQKEESEKINEEVILEERVSMEEEKTIMDTIKDSDDTFVTYHIHIVKENETIESICSMYNASLNLVQEYNNIDNMTMGDKILIPKLDE